MSDKVFSCLQCGNCCKTKFLCLYPHELEKATKLAQQLNINLEFEPLLSRIDFKNKVILDLIYKLKIRPCPFYIENKCLIHDKRFIACKKYPYANWTKTPKLFVKLMKFPEYFYELDTKCSFISKFYPSKRNIPDHIFPLEYKALKMDMTVFQKIEDKLNELNDNSIIELKKEIKFKESFPEQYKNIQNNWEHIPFTNYLPLNDQ